PLGQLREGDRIRIAPEMGLKSFKELLSASRLELYLQFGQDAVEYRCCPALLESFRWVGFGGGYAEITLFGILLVEREQLSATPALLSPHPVVLIAQEIFNRGHQKATEPAALACGLCHVLLFQEAGEKCLRQILRLFRRIASLANERINGKPVALAQAG